jgi:hypothetical protein
MRKYRTLEKKEEDRNNILTVLKRATDWARPKYVSKRISTSPSNIVNHDLLTMVSAGTLQRTSKPYRYAITGKFIKNQHIKDRPQQLRCRVCSTTTTSYWRKNNTCNKCYCAQKRKERQTISVVQPNMFNKNKSWSNEEEALLLKEINDGLTTSEIATRHGRTIKAIESRVGTLKLSGDINRDVSQPININNKDLLVEITNLIKIKETVRLFLSGNLTLNQLKEMVE